MNQKKREHMLIKLPENEVAEAARKTWVTPDIDIISIHGGDIASTTEGLFTVGLRHGASS